MLPLHRVNLICLGDQKLFTDVGFGGPMPAGALVLEEDTRQEMRGSFFHFKKRPNNRWVLYRETSTDQIDPVVQFVETPAEEVDFITPCFYSSTHPDSMFTKSRIANMRYKDGFASISNGQFRLLTGEGDTSIPIESTEHEFELLKEYYGINLQNINA
jgi:N-hydroxyarylamine O-acetyltransferase